MITIIRNAEVYKPEKVGIKDVLLVGDKIAAIDDHIAIDLARDLSLALSMRLIFFS